MKTKIDYSKSPAPAHDAVQDIKDYFGGRWDLVSTLMRDVKDREQFAAYAALPRAGQLSAEP